mgnify:CR=1 FL=1
MYKKISEITTILGVPYSSQDAGGDDECYVVEEDSDDD